MRPNDRYGRWRELSLEIEEGRSYTSDELEDMATSILSWARRAEACPLCESEGQEVFEVDRQLDEAPRCPNGHRWDRGAGTAKLQNAGGPTRDGWLSPGQERQRREREIMTRVGVPDPAIYRGVFGRAHNPNVGRMHGATDNDLGAPDGS